MRKATLLMILKVSYINKQCYNADQMLKYAEQC